MTKLLIASAVIALIASVLLTPLITKKREDGQSKKVIGYFFIGAFILGFLATGITLYVTKIDVNWLVFWPAIILLTLGGALLASGIERKIKGTLFLASLVVAAYVKQCIGKFLAKNNLSFGEIDVVILGFSGDSTSDKYYTETMDLFPDSALLYYKHLSGEFNTASGFSMFMASHILKDQHIPEPMMINTVKKDTIKNVLLYNHLLGSDHSLVLLEKV